MMAGKIVIGKGKQVLACGVALLLISHTSSADPARSRIVEPRMDQILLAHDTGAEVAFWESVKNADDSKELEAYLLTFPNGVFAALARIRLARLKPSTQSGPVADKTGGQTGEIAIPPMPTALQTLGHIGADWDDVYRLGVFAGVNAVRVFRFGTAADAGLMPGDIASSMDRRPITSSEQVSNYMKGRAPGVSVELEVDRNGARASIDITIADWLDKVWAAAHQGDSDAARQLGNAYAANDLIAQDFAASRNWLERAGQSGSDLAYLDLGLQYLDGKGVDKDSKKAFFYVLKSAQAGSPKGQLKAARMYANGWGIEEDQEAALQWYHRAAENGNAAAMRSLGLQYDVGGIVKEDMVQAAHWYEKAANAGNLDATADLGEIYQNGEAGRKKNMAEALRLYRVAADRGNAHGLYHLGRLYEWGDGVVQDRDEAIRLYRLAATKSVVARISLKAMGVPLYDSMEIQNLLSKLGFDPGPVDGAIGAKTREAIVDFQRTFGMVGAGEPSIELVKALRKVDLLRNRIAAKQLKKTPARTSESSPAQTPATLDSDLSDLGTLD